MHYAHETQVTTLKMLLYYLLLITYKLLNSWSVNGGGYFWFVSLVEMIFLDRGVTLILESYSIFTEQETYFWRSRSTIDFSWYDFSVTHYCLLLEIVLMHLLFTSL